MPFSTANVFQALSKPEDGWEYQTDKVEFHDGMLCIHMRQDSEQQQPLQNCVAYLDTNGNIVIGNVPSNRDIESANRMCEIPGLFAGYLDSDLFNAEAMTASIS